MTHLITDIFSSTIGITCLVMVMMLLIEFVNVSSSGKLLEKLSSRPFLQIIVAALLGLIPGCIGGFTIVSLYTHHLLTFGALVAGMVSTFGDSAFLLFAISPQVTPLLFALLFAIALIAGVVTHAIFRHRPVATTEAHTLQVHAEHTHAHGSAQLSLLNIRKISFARAVLLFGLVLYLTALGTGAISHAHGSMPKTQQFIHQEHTSAIAHCTAADCDHSHGAHEACHEDHHLHGENIVFGILALLTLIIVAFCSEHFLQEHLWEHVIKHHFVSVLLWTLGVLLFLAVINHFVDIELLIAKNHWMMWGLLLLALCLGIVPESQPQFIWIYLYAAGIVPFSILLASSVVQDGHGALPLLASSRMSFLMMKAVNLIFGFIVGALGLCFGF